MTSATEELATTVECIGCGFCCSHNQCSESVRLFGVVARCPVLLWHRARIRYVCGLLYLIEYKDTSNAESLAIGEGCCSPCNEWRNNVNPRNKEDET